MFLQILDDTGLQRLDKNFMKSEISKNPERVLKSSNHTAVAVLGCTVNAAEGSLPRDKDNTILVHKGAFHILLGQDTTIADLVQVYWRHVSQVLELLRFVQPSFDLSCCEVCT